MVNRRERLSVDPRAMVGKPCIAGTRVPVSHILDKLAAGISMEQVLRDYPRVSRDDVLAALAYASHRVEPRRQ